MGLPCVGTGMPKPITGLLELLGHLKFILLDTLFHLPHQNIDCVLPEHCPSPSLVQVPVYIVSESIKKRLPVVKYTSFLEISETGEDGDSVCAICLNCLERSDEIRQLCNCSHMFHRECLDKWVDQSQLVCPLRRSKLLPAQREETRDGGEDCLLVW